MGNSVGIALFVILIANKIPHLLNMIPHTGSVLASGDKYAAITGQPGKRGKESEQHVQGVHDLPANWFMGGVVLTGEEWRRRLGDSVVEANLRTQEYICLRYFLYT